ncbi:MAG: pyridoxine 5'-phosphate synthase [Betaproteobacteria bacterium]|nr:pyridoxine 5'-phosphate synthase [Betaproteobacteria bacterium]
MTRLSVNLNKVALVRNSRTLGIPSVVRAGEIALDAGARGLTVHPRPDERHIRPHDVYDLAALVRGRASIEYNIEGNPFENLLDYARKLKPHQCTLVPDDPAQFTSDHGWDLKRDGARLKPIIAEMKALGTRVSLFMDAEPSAMVLAVEVGADCVELYTEPYAAAYGKASQNEVLAQYAASARAAQQAGLLVNAGHDLNRDNLAALIAAAKPVAEVSIGHALIADAIELGLAATVREYLAAIARGEQGDV